MNNLQWNHIWNDYTLVMCYFLIVQLSISDNNNEINILGHLFLLLWRGLGWYFLFLFLWMFVWLFQFSFLFIYSRYYCLLSMCWNIYFFLFVYYIFSSFPCYLVFWYYHQLCFLLFDQVLLQQLFVLFI